MLPQPKTYIELNFRETKLSLKTKLSAKSGKRLNFVCIEYKCWQYTAIEVLLERTCVNIYCQDFSLVGSKLCTAARPPQRALAHDEEDEEEDDEDDQFGFFGTFPKV